MRSHLVRRAALALALLCAALPAVGADPVPTPVTLADAEAKIAQARETLARLAPESPWLRSIQESATTPGRLPDPALLTPAGTDDLSPRETLVAARMRGGAILLRSAENLLARGTTPTLLRLAHSQAANALLLFRSAESLLEGDKP